MKQLVIVASALFPCIALANPNQAGSPQGNGESFARAERYSDEFSNSYEISRSLYGKVMGTLSTEGCSTTQELHGKIIQDTWTLVIHPTSTGDCLGGLVVLDGTEKDLVGVWKAVDGTETEVNLQAEN